MKLTKFGLFFSKVLEGLGYNVPEAELTTFLNQLDIDKSGEQYLFMSIEIILILFFLRNY
jgi:hypothetical protein